MQSAEKIKPASHSDDDTAGSDHVTTAESAEQTLHTAQPDDTS